MNPEHITAIIAASAALGGVILTVGGGLLVQTLTSRQQLRREIQLRRFQQRLDAYDRASQFAWDFMYGKLEGLSEEEGPRRTEEARALNRELVLVAHPTVPERFRDLIQLRATPLRLRGVAEHESESSRRRPSRTCSPQCDAICIPERGRSTTTSLDPHACAVTAR